GLPVRYIDEIVTHIPEDKLWFETFTLNANGAISLSGIVLDNQAFAAYVESLRVSNFIANVNTQRTSRRTVDGRGLIAFQCSVTAQEYFETFNVNGSTNG
ncbi:MAG: PilN domain-containing protein, partial [Desulfovibrionales bacterium]|nr:PilN domain-containing protein [Desulfovibrionales bacterium]